MSGIDDVFSPEAAPPARPPVDRLRRIGTLLTIAFPLNLFGVFCFTGVPGAVMALIGWHLTDEEIARVHNGAVPKSELPRARWWRDFAFSQLLLAMASFVLQIYLFADGTYEGWIVAILNLFMGGGEELLAP